MNTTFGYEMRAICAFALSILLTGCASHDPNLKRIDGPSITIREKVIFSAVSGDPAGPRYFHALKPGLYHAIMEDIGGVYYAGDGALLILGGQVNQDGSVEEPLANGGFWLAKGQASSPRMRLFYMPDFGIHQPAMVEGVATNAVNQRGPGATPAQGAVGGALGGVVVGAIVASGAAGYGPKNGEPLFVPRRSVEEEELRFVSALAKGRGESGHQP